MAQHRFASLASVLRMLAVLALFAYPFIIYFGLQAFEPRQIVLMLVLLAVCRLMGGQARDEVFVYWLGALGLAAVCTVVLNSSLGLLFYPVLMNVAMLVFFAGSLFRPATVIELIARRQEGELSNEAIAYTRKVTVAWCMFFLLNALISSATVFMNKEVWLLYNGFVSYVLMGTLFVVEYLIRKRVQKHAN